MHIFVRPLIVFDTQWNSTVFENYRVLQSPKELKKFLLAYDFIAPSVVYTYKHGAPSFRLGTKYIFSVDGYDFTSDIKWGPRFWVGRNIRTDGKRMFIESPTAPISNICADGTETPHVWREVPFQHGMADAVIDLKNLRQIWPKCEGARSELAKFIARASRERMCVRSH